jgi:hypothetical protein
MTVKDVDHGYRRLVEIVFGLERPVITVGIFESEGSKMYASDDMTLLEVAIIHEFGTDKIPERSFIRAWFDENQDRCREALRVMLEVVVAGKYTKEQSLELLAQRFVGEIQKRIAAGIPPPLAQSTIDRKGSSTPLINTGQLRSGITYKIT